MLRYMILGLLRRGECVHGYALWKAYERRSGQIIQNGKFYRTLKGLAHAGYIRPMERPESDPRRTSYELTPAGSAAFDEWVISSELLTSTAEDPISSRALFLFELSPDVASAFFLGLEDVLSARWKRLEYDRERVLSRPGIAERERSVQSLLLTRHLERTSADLSWLREARSRYEQLHVAPAVAASPRPGAARARPESRARR